MLRDWVHCPGTGQSAVKHHSSLGNVFRITGLDVNQRATRLARLNQRRLGIPTSMVSFVTADITDAPATTAAIANNDALSAFDCCYTIDMIVSNPPYISQTEDKLFDKSVSHWEDPRALLDDTHPDGAAFYRAIAEQYAVNHAQCVLPSLAFEYSGTP